ncbi:MAG TPA: hypothetical protein VGG35_14055 [Streptosporangiaceae bacterium]
MGLMDKVKAQADKLAQQAQDTAREGKARLDQAQANKHADVLLRNLGALLYAERTNRGTPDTEAQVARVTGEISAHEAEFGINLAPQAAGWRPPPSGAPGGTGTPGGTGAAGDTGAPGGTPSTPFTDPQSSSFPPPGTPDAPPPGSTNFPPSGSTGFPPQAPPNS